MTQLTIREIEAYFRGSLLGKVWAVVVPLCMLGMYTLVFGVVLHVRWPGQPRTALEVSLLYFGGLILSNFFVECISRAPVLLTENPSYIKRVVFPLEILAWVTVGAALFRALIAVVIMILYYLVIEGLPPLSAVAAPLALVPLAIISVGIVWILSALGVYIRDLRHVMGVIVPAMMFLAPIFFPLSAVPGSVRFIFYVNPLTFAVETVRNALFFGAWPDWLGLAGYNGAAVLVAVAGFALFSRLRPGFADVI